MQWCQRLEADYGMDPCIWQVEVLIEKQVHMIFTRPRFSPHIDGQLGHLLLYMQLETIAQGVLVSSYSCSTYRVAVPYSSLGNFSSSSDHLVTAICKDPSHNQLPNADTIAYTSKISLKGPSYS